MPLGAGVADGDLAGLLSDRDVLTVHSEEATLEDVFVHFAGRGLDSMSGTAVAAILRKDAKEYGADRFFLLMTVASIVFYPLLFWLLPAAVNETIRVGVVQTGLDEVIESASGSGLELVPYAYRRRPGGRPGSGRGRPGRGGGVPAGLPRRHQLGRPSTVTLLVPSDVPRRGRDDPRGRRLRDRVRPARAATADRPAGRRGGARRRPGRGPGPAARAAATADRLLRPGRRDPGARHPGRRRRSSSAP